MEFKLAAADYPAVTASLPGQPIALSGSSISGLDLEVWTLQRSGDRAMLLVFALHNPGSATLPTGVKAEGLSAGNQRSGSVTGVSAVDGSGLKQYLPFMINPADERTCLCSLIDVDDFKPDQRNFYAALLAAPPRNVKSLTVVTGIGSVPNVALS